MKKQIVGVVLVVSLSSSIAALAQSHLQKGQIMSPNIEPVGAPGDTPEQIAKNEAVQIAREHKIHHLNLAAQEAMNAGNYALAETTAQQSVDLGTPTAKGLEILAAAFDAQGKSQQALDVYTKISKRGNVFPKNMLPYSLLLLKSGQWAAAVAAYNRQLPYNSGADLMQTYTTFSPSTPNPTALTAAIHMGLGMTEGWQGYHGSINERLAQELEHFKQALALAPNSSLAHYYHGVGLQRLGRFSEAKAAWEKASSLDSGNVKAAAKKEIALYHR
jgi:tetratricopeptide (TPR) repeat protein